MKNKKLLILSSLFLTFAMTSCGENFPSHISYPEGDDGSVQTPYEEYDNGKRVESISFKENDVSLNLSVSSEYQIEASIAPSDAHNPKLTYESNTPDVAVVDDTGKVTMVAPGNASISVKADNGVSANFNISGYIPATSIKINPHVEGGALLDIYDTKQFSIAAEPANATQKDVTWSVVDKDGNPTNVALISETGLLSFENAKGVHDLEFNVIATSKADASLVASEKVIVNDARKYASSVKISKDGGEVSSVDVLLGSPIQLEAVVDPVDHTNPVSWSSEDATVATVDEGLVSAVKAPASTNVKASIDGLESKVVVKTTKVDVTAVSLDKTSLTLNKGEEATLVATVAPSDASFPDVAFVVADGSNEFVSIDDNGKVTAKKQTGSTPAKVMAVSKDNNEIYAECSVTVTNKVTAIEIVNNYEKMYYGGETYTLSLNKTPYDCEDFDVTWASSNDSIATVDADGVVTTNNAELTGTVTIEATVNGTDIGDFIDINIIKPAAPFTAGKMYLVGNRNYQASGLDFDHASWDDSDYAVELTSTPDPNYKNQWALTNFHFERYDVETGGGDLFKIRSVDWPEFSLDQSSTKSAYFTEEGNLAVSNSEKYDLYFKENLDDSFSLYIMSEFKNGTMYLVGNRDYHTGESSGVAGTDTSWNDSSKALALTHDEAQGQYHVANTFEANDEFKVRSDMFYDIALGTDEKTAAIAHVDEITGNIVLNKAGKFDIYFKSELGVWTVYMAEYHEPVVYDDHIIWGSFGGSSEWSKINMSLKPGSETEYMYTGNFAKGDVFVIHMDGDTWYNYNDVKEGCISLVGCVEGGTDIKITKAGTYTIYADYTADDKGDHIWVSYSEPTGPSIVFGITNPEVAVNGTLEIPVTATNCSGLTYSITDGNEYITLDLSNSDDTKLIVNGSEYEGTSTVKAVASDGTEATIEVVCTESPTPVEDKDYVVKVCHDEVWSQLDMSQTVGDESQYEYTGDFDKDDVFVIHMEGETWYHFEDVKEGCLSLVSLEGSEDIKFNEAGKYTIYADYDADENGDHIWISKAPIPVVGDFSVEINGVSNDLTLNEKSGEYYIDNIDLSRDDLLEFYNGDEKLTVSAKVAPEGSANNCFLNSSNKIELIRSLPAKEGEGIYFDPVKNEVWVHGNHESFSVVCNGEEYDLDPAGSGDGYTQYSFNFDQIDDGEQIVFSKNGLVVDAGPENTPGNNATADTYKGNACCKITTGGKNLSVYLKVYLDRYEVWVGEAKGDVVTVTFTINYKTEDGQGIYIVGDFCGWDPTKGIRGTWTDGHNWVFEITQDIGTDWEFKFVLNSYSDPTDPAIDWEKGSNRTYTFNTNESKTYYWQTA